MSASKRPSTSSLRRFITSRPYVPVAELRRRFGLDEPEAMAHLRHNGTSAWIGLPEREAAKLQDLWDRDEVGVELSVEVRAPVVVGVYPMRIARYVVDGSNGGPGNGAMHGGSNGMNGSNGNGRPEARLDNGNTGGFRRRWQGARRGPRGTSTDSGPSHGPGHPHAPRPMPGAPDYGSSDPARDASDDRLRR